MIPGSVATIGSAAFQGCSELTNVTISYGVTNLGDNAFAGCRLTSVTIPGSVTTIGEAAFEQCVHLTNATFANGVTSIEADAFEYCPLTNVTIPASVTNLGNGVFEYCPLASVYAACGAATIVPSYGYIFVYSQPPIYYLSGAAGWTTNFSKGVLWNPQIQAGGASFGVQNNQFGFNITGTTNIPIVIEACTNLSQPVWVPLQSVTLTNGSVYFSDPQWTNYPSRLYGIGFP
jgi:hypothetical protein